MISDILIAAGAALAAIGLLGICHRIVRAVLRRRRRRGTPAD